jgi:hypothetical protein
MATTTLFPSSVSFVEYNIEHTHLLSLGIVFSLLLVGTVVGAKLYVFPKPEDAKRLSWVITLVNSFLTSIAGFVYTVQRAPEIYNVVSVGASAVKLFHSKDDVAVIIALWFGIANAVDLSFGLLLYRKHLDPLTAYVHHTVFIWLMFLCTTGQGGFCTSRPFVPLFVFALVEEFPTFLLALGSVFPKYRTDLGFGITFFVLRLAYHIAMFGYAVYSGFAGRGWFSYKNGFDVPVLVMYSFTTLMHVNWFSGWFSKYAFPKSKKAKKIDGEKQIYAQEVNKKLE